MRGNRRMDPISILIVDDHPVVRDGIRYMLRTSPEIRVVAEASTGLEALERVRVFHPRVVLMDIRMPDMDGLEATRRIKEQFPESCVVIMTMHDDEEYVVQAVQAGAAGYLLKDAPKAEVCRTIEAAAGGDTTIKASLLQRAMKSVRNGSEDQQRKALSGWASMAESLTPRESAVLRLVVDGKTNREIGETLFISEDTAKKHVQSLVAKLGASDRTTAAVTALRLGLVE